MVIGYGLWVNLIRRAEPHHECAGQVRDVVHAARAHAVALQVACEKAKQTLKNQEYHFQIQGLKPGGCCKLEVN
jgi:hypothetical protein